MSRIEFLPCLYRDRDGTIQEREYPKTEPDPYDVPADLYCSSYEVQKGLIGPPRLGNLEVVIFNTRGYRRDLALEQEARERLVRAILAREGPDIVQAAAGIAAVKARIDVGPWWEERS